MAADTTVSQHAASHCMTWHHVVLCHAMSRCAAQHRVASRRVASRRITSHRIVPHRIASNRSCRVERLHTAPYRIVGSGRVMPHHAESYGIMSCRIVSCRRVASCLVFVSSCVVCRVSCVVCRVSCVVCRVSCRTAPCRIPYRMPYRIPYSVA